MAPDAAKADILPRLNFCADNVDDIPVSDLEAILREAASTIETLRTLVGIKDEIHLEGIEPIGNA